MRLLGAIFAILLILVIGGGLTAQIIASNDNPSSVLPLLKQTDDPNASVFDSPPWKSEQFFLLVGFVLFNMIGMGVTIAAVMWYLNREVVRSRAAGGESTSIQPAESETAVEET